LRSKERRLTGTERLDAQNRGVGALRDASPESWGRFANAENLLTQCRRFLVEPDEAAKLICEMEATVKARWHAAARAEGVTEQDCERIRGAFAHEGFRQ